MTATFRQAQDDMLAIVRDVAAQQQVPVVYESVKGGPPAENRPWVQPQIRHDFGGDASLTGGLGGKRRYSRTGVLWIRIYMPMGAGLAGGYDLGGAFVHALQGKSTDHCVWFRNVRLTEVGPSGVWYQFNVLANFTYDEVR